MPNRHFRRSFVVVCQALVKQRSELTKRNWILFAYFVADLYKLIRVRNEPLRTISVILFEIVTGLSRLKDLQDFDQVLKLQT